jgi:DNA-binding response OmpR family regulator
MEEQMLLVEREDPQATDLAEIRHYLRIYSELHAFKTMLLQRAHRDVERFSGDTRGVLQATDIAEFEAQLEHIHQRLVYWRDRFWDLHGVDLDRDALTMSHAGKSVLLTRREFELLKFLLDKPGEYFRPRQLLLGAWGDVRLSEEQLRTYLGRIRHRLAEVDLPVRVVSRRRLGYTMEVE